MSEKIQLDKQHTYNNWKAITESDFVTLFIKTWFAFIATLRELYPHSSKPYYQASGDAPYLSSYKADFSDNFLFFCSYDSIVQNLHDVYRLGLRVTCEKYPRFLVQDFYSINNSFREFHEEKFKSPGGYEGNLRLTIRNKEAGIAKAELLCSDKKFIEDAETDYIVVSVEINYNDILEKIIQTIEATHVALAENELITQFYSALFGEVTTKLIYKLEQKRNVIPEKGHIKLRNVFSAMQSFCMRAAESIKNLCLSADISEEYKLLAQSPVTDFLQSFGELSPLEKQRAFLWFIGYSYRLRNALFHEIIDPLDATWQLIFKNAYLVLKQIVDSNINWLKTTTMLKSKAPQIFIDDFKNAPPPQIPIEKDDDTTFSIDNVELKYYNQSGATVHVWSTIICKGTSFHIECNIKWDEKLENPKVKNVQILERD